MISVLNMFGKSDRDGAIVLIDWLIGVLQDVDDK